MAENPPTPEAGKDDKNILVVDSPVKSAQETFELLTKIFVVAAAVLYITGFLIVSLHLARYGVHSFSILRAQYILAGTWIFAHILFFVPIALVLWYLIHRFTAKYRIPSSVRMDEEKWARLGKVNIIWLGVVNIYILNVLFGHGISIFKFNEIHTLVLQGATTVFILLYGYFLWNHFIKLWTQKLHIFSQLLIFCVYLFLYMSDFSKDVYSKIPPEYGGGAPVKVQFHWKDESKTKDIATTFKKECKLAEEPVYFNQILATDTGHVIISPCPKEYPRSFEISNDLIDWVEIKYEQKEDIKL